MKADEKPPSGCSSCLLPILFLAMVAIAYLASRWESVIWPWLLGLRPFLPYFAIGCMLVAAWFVLKPPTRRKDQ